LTLTAASNFPQTGVTETLIASVADDDGKPVPGLLVRFNVTGANSRGGTETTDNLGQAGFRYSATYAGTGTVDAFADFNDNGIKNNEEPSDSQTIPWEAGPADSLGLSADNTNPTAEDPSVLQLRSRTVRIPSFQMVGSGSRLPAPTRPAAAPTLMPTGK
jgi:hypothetical protein